MYNKIKLYAEVYYLGFLIFVNLKLNNTIFINKILKNKTNHSKQMDLNEIHQLSECLEYFANYIPFRFLCYEKALTGKYYLQKKGINSTLKIGKSKNEKFHSWLDYDGLSITGYKNKKDFQELFIFQ